MSATSKGYRHPRISSGGNVGRIVICLLLVICYLSHTVTASAYDNEQFLFTKIEGAADSQIRSIIQLPDGRTAFATESGIDIFNGSGFSHLYSVTGDRYRLDKYDGYHHLYITHNGKYLWIKNQYELQCVDLDTELYSTDISSLLKTIGYDGFAEDIFADLSGNLWIVAEGNISLPDSEIKIPLQTEEGDLLDFEASEKEAWLFYRSGLLTCIDLSTGKRIYSKRAYPESDAPLYAFTSQMVKSDGNFYQIRNGAIGGLFRFDPESQDWTTLLKSNLRLNTIATTDSTLFITTTEGLLILNRDGTEVEHLSRLRTQSGNLLASQLSSIATDGKDGIWIGTYNRGIFYHNPHLFRHISIPKTHTTSSDHSHISSVFSENHDGSINVNDNGREFTLTLPDKDVGLPIISELRQRDDAVTGEYGSDGSFVASNGALFFNEPANYSIFIPQRGMQGGGYLKPFISSIIVNGETTEPLKAYDGEVILSKIPSRTDEITLDHNQNFITFEITCPDISNRNPRFLFRMDGIDPDWRISSGKEVKDRMFRTTYTALPPGKYIFRIHLSSISDSPETSIGITILPPWWRTPWAITLYAFATLLLVFSTIRVYIKRTKRKIEAEQREESLLARIRQLIEEVDRYKSESPTREEQSNADSLPSGSPLSEEDKLSEEEKAFVARAIEMVEKNLNTPGYSVMQLSNDLCMDRTGLYRKLTTMLDRSPSLFIRDIRLRKAAALLKEGRLSITEIAEATGFSTTSYMSKCFQERYGCRPSEFNRGK